MVKNGTMTRRMPPHSGALAFVSLGIVLLNGTVVAHGMRRVMEADTWISHTQDVMQEAQRLLSALQDAETGQRGLLITGAPSYLEPYDEGVSAVGKRFGRLRELTRDNPEQQQRLDVMHPLIERKLAELRRTIGLRQREERRLRGGARTGRPKRGQALMDDLRRLIAAISATEARLMDERVHASRAASRWVLAADVLGVLASVLLVGLAYQLLLARQRERTLAAAALSAESTRLRTTLISTGDGVIVTDGAGKITMLNPTAGALMGWGDDAVGRPLEEVFRIVNERTRQTVESPITKVLREGAVVGLANHTVLITHDGHEVPIDDSGAPIRLSDESIVGAVLVFRDITERKRAEAALREREERLAVTLRSIAGCSDRDR